MIFDYHNCAHEKARQDSVCQILISIYHKKENTISAVNLNEADVRG